MYSLFNDKIVLEKSVGIALDDTAIIRGYGAFQVIRVYDKKPFLVSEHLKKLKKDADFLGINFNCDERELIKKINLLLKKNNLSESYLRIVLTGGKSEDGLNPSGKPSFFVLQREVALPEKEDYQRGVFLITLNHKRVLPKAKTTDYLFPIHKKRLLQKQQAFDFLYKWNSKILESTRANFFAIKKDVLITPKNNVLEGVTRDKVLEIAQKIYRIEERDFYYKELSEVDEVFLTSTIKEILPVRKIDDIEFNDFQKTEKIIKEYKKMVGWLSGLRQRS